VVKNKRECQLVPNWGRSNAETAGSKRCVDTRNRQQIGVGRA